MTNILIYDDTAETLEKLAIKEDTTIADIVETMLDYKVSMSSVKESKKYNESREESFEYRGFGIDYDIYGDGEYTVQYCGDDVIFDTEDEAIEFIDSIIEEESTNCGSIGQHKRCSIDLVDSSRFDVDEDEEELLVEVDDNSIESEDELEEIDSDVDDDEYDIDDSDIVNIDGDDSTNPMSNMQSKKSGSNSIDL